MNTHADAKLVGTISEAAFQHQALTHGLIVSKPYGDYAKYDFVIDTRSKLLKIQVKATNVLTYNRNSFGRYRITLGHGLNKNSYTSFDFDYLAAHIIPSNTWYIVPKHSLGSRKIMWLYPHRPNVAFQYEKFKNHWKQLTEQ